MIQIAVCDDEQTVCQEISQEIAHFLSGQAVEFTVRQYTDAAAFCAQMDTFDLVYLDIRMPELDGITLARQIRSRELACIVVFITGLRDYMLDAFDVEALDYICKPIERARLRRSVERALQQIAHRQETGILIQTAHWCKAVKLSAIYYCEVINRKIYLHTTEGVLEYYGKLKEMEKQLDARFFKCHRSYLVNLDHLKMYQDGEIVLENGSRIPVSRLRHQELMEKMLEYMKD